MAKTLEQKIDTMFDEYEYEMENLEEIQKLVSKIPIDTDPFWYLVSVLVKQSTESKKEIKRLAEKVEELENVNERMSDSFRRKNEYGY